MFYTLEREGFTLSTDPARLQMDAIYQFLSQESYWATGIARSIVERAVQGSLCFGIYQGDRQAAFARVITDRATFAYLCDLFVLPEFRGQGLGEWLVESILAHPELQGLRRWLLFTRDAHGLYARFGFTELPPSKGMQIVTSYR